MFDSAGPPESLVFDGAGSLPRRYPSLNSFLSGQSKSVLVTLTTGNPTAPTSTLRVHEHLLLPACDFFRAALTDGYKETSDGAVEFPEDTKETMLTFVEWLYSSKVPSTTPHLQLLNAYVFGAKIICDGFVNAIMHLLYEANKDTCQFAIEEITLVDKYVLPNFELRRFMADVIARGILSGEINWSKEQWEQIGGDVAIEINMALARFIQLNLVNVELPRVAMYL